MVAPSHASRFNQPPPCEIQIGERQQRTDLGAAFEDAAVAHIAIAELQLRSGPSRQAPLGSAVARRHDTRLEGGTAHIGGHAKAGLASALHDAVPILVGKLEGETLVHEVPVGSASRPVKCSGGFHLPVTSVDEGRARGHRPPLADPGVPGGMIQIRLEIGGALYRRPLRAGA